MEFQIKCVYPCVNASVHTCVCACACACACACVHVYFFENNDNTCSIMMIPSHVFLS